jgi:catechol 2,3-dioxygenase-like lactoylglutathione lyase family enzyme
MALHRLTTVTIGVPDVAETARYYAEFGLDQVAPGRFATLNGGEQVAIEHAPSRRLNRLGAGVDDPDDPDRIDRQLQALGLPVSRSDGALHTADPISGAHVDVTITARLAIPEVPAPTYNGPGRAVRIDARAAGVLRTKPVRPQKLGHVVIGTVDKEASQRFFTDGLGFRISDNMAAIAAFMRCSTDHHNVLVQQSPPARTARPDFLDPSHPAPMKEAAWPTSKSLS